MEQFHLFCKLSYVKCFVKSPIIKSENEKWKALALETILNLLESNLLKESEPIQVAELLIKLKKHKVSTKVLLSYLHTIPIRFWGLTFMGGKSKEALQMLKDMDQGLEVSKFLVEVAWNKRHDIDECIPALHELKNWGPLDENQVASLKQLVFDASLDNYHRVSATESLTYWSTIDEDIRTEMWAIMHDDETPLFIRADAAYVLGLSGQTDRACQFLLKLLWHEQLDEFDDLNSDVCRFLVDLAPKSELVLPRLQSAAFDKNVNGGGRYYAAMSLIELKTADSGQRALFELMHDSNVEDWVLLEAASSFLEMKMNPEAIKILDQLANDTGISGWIRANAGITLAKAGQTEKAARILLAIARNLDEYDLQGSEIMDTLMKAGTVDELLILYKELLSSPNISDRTRYSLANRLMKIDRVEDAVEEFLYLAQSKTTNGNVRLNAIIQLGSIGSAKDSISDTLIELASDEEEWVRRMAHISLKAYVGFEVG